MTTEEGTARVPGRLVVPLDDEGAATLESTGGKGANLARLVAAGLPVPPGFCVTTAVYDALADTPDVQAAIESLETLDPAETEAIAEQSAAVRTALRQRELPDHVRTAVVDALETLDADAYAVRSSATAEDLPTASFAGQHETFLGVPGAQILDRIRDCLASLFTDRAVAYRLRNDIPHGEVAMAVVVQSMVDASVAGVLFTADPISGNRHVASVDANYGLGDTVVAGEVSPDNARVDRRTGAVLEYEVGEKQHVLRSRGGTDGTELAELSAERRASRALSDAQLRTLVDLGANVEDLFDAPQDVEWALVDGEFVLLQSRPITSLFPLPSPSPDDDRLHVYFSFGHAQAMADALPPLVVDWWRALFDRTATRVRGHDRERAWAVEAGHRVFVDLTPLVLLGPLQRRLPTVLGGVNEPASAGLEDLLARRSAEFTPRGRLETARVVGGVVRRWGPSVASRLPQLLGRFARLFSAEPPDPRDEQARLEALGEDLAAQIRAPDSQVERVQIAFEAFDLPRVLGRLLPLVGPLLVGALLSQRALHRLFPDAEADVEAVGKGLDGDLVTRMNQRLGDLADVAREHPEVRTAVREAASLAAIADVAGGDAFLAEFEAFLDEFGHRASSEIDLGRPRWRDDPATLLRTVRSDLVRAEAGAHREHLGRLEREAEAAAARLERRASRGPLGPIRRRVVRRLIRAYRGGFQFREYPKQGVAHLFTAVHDELAAAGETLAADGRLARPDDVWYLHETELLAALEEGVSIDVDVEARRRAYERDAKRTAPPLLTSEGETPTAQSATAADSDTLTGTAVSSGVVEGPARVIRDPAGESLEKGEILVAPSTDPGWTPLFLNAAGLVMEVGGRMTHGALVAREYGIPAVVSVGNATERIQTGDRVRVDGAAGTVELLDRAETGDETTETGS